MVVYLILTGTMFIPIIIFYGVFIDGGGIGCVVVEGGGVMVLGLQNDWTFKRKYLWEEDNGKLVISHGL